MNRIHRWATTTAILAALAASGAADTQGTSLGIALALGAVAAIATLVWWLTQGSQ